MKSTVVALLASLMVFATAGVGYSGPLLELLPKYSKVLEVSPAQCPDRSLRIVTEFDVNGDGDVDVRLFTTMDGEELAAYFFTPDQDEAVRLVVPLANGLGVRDIPASRENALHAVCGFVKPAIWS